MKAVLDTNVLVSGLINTHQAPGRIVDRVRTRDLQLVVDDRILSEYRSVLLGNRMRKWIDLADARDLLSFLYFDSEYVVANVSIQGLPDTDDVPFIEVALTAAVPLVTGNKKHFPASACQGHRIITPADFVCLL